VPWRTRTFLFKLRLIGRLERYLRVVECFHKTFKFLCLVVLKYSNEPDKLQSVVSWSFAHPRCSRNTLISYVSSLRADVSHFLLLKGNRRRLRKRLLFRLDGKQRCGLPIGGMGNAASFTLWITKKRGNISSIEAIY